MAAPGPQVLARLCADALPREHLTTDELSVILEGATVLGDSDGAAAFTLRHHGEHTAAFLLLVVVRPELQGAGRGTALVHEVMDRVRAAPGDAPMLHVGNAAPRYVWPGYDATDTRAGMFFESLGIQPGPLGVNMAIPTSFRADPPPGIRVERATPGRADAARAVAARAYPHWSEELDLAVAAGTAFVALDASGAAVGFGCHSVFRHGWIGPMATDPDHHGSGIGSAYLAAVCADLEARGVATGEIAWVSNLRFYGKCGARVSRLFRTGHIPLR